MPRSSAKDDVREREHDLVMACVQNDMHTVQRLLSAGVSVNCQWPSMYTGDRPATSQELALSTGMTPLFTAVRYDHTALLDLLLSHGADATVSSAYDRTPLQEAVGRGNLRICKTLLKRFPALLGVADDDTDRSSALCTAAVRHPVVLILLIESGARVDPPLRFRARADSPLLAACRVASDVPASVAILVNAGADVYSCNHYGASPLNTLVRGARWRGLALLLAAAWRRQRRAFTFSPTDTATLREMDAACVARHVGAMAWARRRFAVVSRQHELSAARRAAVQAAAGVTN